MNDADKQEWLQRVADCENRDELLSTWERGFIRDTRAWLTAYGRFSTDKHADKLLEIWDRVTQQGRGD